MILHLIANASDGTLNSRFLRTIDAEWSKLSPVPLKLSAFERRADGLHGLIAHRPSPHSIARLAARFEDMPGPRIYATVGEEAFRAVAGLSEAATRKDLVPRYAMAFYYSHVLNAYIMPLDEPLKAQWDATQGPMLVRSLQKLHRALSEYAATGAYPEPPELHWRRCSSPSKIEAWLRRSSAPLSLDFEIWGEGAERVVRCLALHDGGKDTLLIPFATNAGVKLLAPEAELAIWHILDLEIVRSGRTIIAQNAMFDIPILSELIGAALFDLKPRLVKGRVDCTMARHNMLYPDLPKALGFQVAWYLYADPYHKDDAKAWAKGSKVSEEALWEYCARDAETTRRVWEAQYADACAAGDYAKAFKRELKVVSDTWRVAYRASMKGVRVDMQAWHTAGEACRRLLSELRLVLAEQIKMPVMIGVPEKEDFDRDLNLLATLAGVKRPFNEPRRLAMLNAWTGIAMPVREKLFRLLVELDPKDETAMKLICSRKLPAGIYCASSSQHKSALLYEKLGLPAQERYKTDARGERSDSVSADGQALKLLIEKLWAAKHSDERIGVLETLLSIGMVSRLLSTYYCATPTERDGRMRCTYNLGGTKTRRFSASKWHDGSGFNMQTLPRGDGADLIVSMSQEHKDRLTALAKITKCAILPDRDDHVLMNFDLEQAESRTVAHEIHDPNLLADLDSGEDFHTRGAMMIYEKAASEVTKSERQDAKKFRHGVPYGMSPAGISAQLRKRLSLCKEIHARVLALYPNMAKWGDVLLRYVILGQPILNGVGWPRRVFADPAKRKTERELRAHVPQSTIPAIVNRAWIAFDALPREERHGARVMLQTHDALLVSVPKANWKALAKTMMGLLEQPVATTPIGEELCPDGFAFRPSYVIPSSCEIGPDYGHMRRVKREELED